MKLLKKPISQEQYLTQAWSKLLDHDLVMFFLYLLAMILW